MDDDDNPKGAYNRGPIFKGENYDYKKENMYVHLLSFEKKSMCSSYRQTFHL